MLTHTIRRRTISAILAASVLGILVPAATMAAEPTTPCPDTHWPAAVQAKPANLHAGSRGGDYFWHDKNGWHLRVTHHGSKRVTFSGRIVSSTPIKVTGVKLEKKDVYTLSADKLTLTYHFKNYGKIDGLDFTTACAQHLRLSGSMSGKHLPASRVWVGKAHVHPLSNPFVVIKVV